MITPDHRATPPSRHRKTVLTLLLLSLAGAFARIYGLAPWDFYHDEIWHVYVAGQPTLAGVLHTDLTADGHPFLPYILWHYLLLIWNDPWMARLPSLIAGILSIPAGYLLGREMFKSTGGAFFCAFFMAFSGLVIEQSDVTRGYMLMLFFTLPGLWSAWRYRTHPRAGYLLLYAASMALALLCEYTAASVVAFAALYLLYGIYEKPGDRFLPFIGWAAIHTALLAYLLGMVALLRHIGALDFSQAHGFVYKHALTTAELVRDYVGYFLDAINDNGFLPWISGASGSTGFFVISFLVSVIIAAAGLIRLVRLRQWEILLLAVTIVIITLAFFFLDIVPVASVRRNMGLCLAAMALFYSGFSYVAQEVEKKHGFRLSPESWTLLATAAMCIGYAAYGMSWRALRVTEFQQTRADAADAFAYLDLHAGRDDIIVTDPSTYYQFWNRERTHCAGDAKPLSASVSYYPCYHIPLYTIRQDMRLGSFIFNLWQFQQALQDLNRLHRLAKVRNVWIVGLQQINLKTMVLYPHFGMKLLKFLKPGEKERYHGETAALIGEQSAFAHYAYQHGLFKKIIYAYSCSTPNGRVNFSDDDDCMMKIVMLALPRAELEERVINHAPFHNPEAFLDGVQRAR